MFRSWARKAGPVGLLIFCVGLLWLWNRSVSGPVVAGILAAGTLLMLGGVGEAPVPFFMEYVPEHWSSWRRRLTAWLFPAGLACSAVSAVLALTLVLPPGPFVMLFLGGVAMTATSLLLSRDALAFRTYDDPGGAWLSSSDVDDDGSW